MVHRGTAATAAGVLSIGVVLIPTGEGISHSTDSPSFLTTYHCILKMLPNGLPKIRIFSVSSVRYILLSGFFLASYQ